MISFIIVQTGSCIVPKIKKFAISASIKVYTYMPKRYNEL